MRQVIKYTLGHNPQVLFQGSVLSLTNELSKGYKSTERRWRLLIRHIPTATFHEAIA